MSLNFSIANVVYVKNLSSDITEENIREKFGSCDEIISITFKNFPGLNQKYCQIEFKTSEGITNASRLNGESLLNVPMVVSVIEPIINNTNLSELSTTECDKNVNSLLDVRNSITNQGVQTLLLQKQVISEQKKRLVDFQNSLNEKNNKFDVFSKIVYMENIPEKYGEEDIKAFFQNVGNTTSYKLQYNEQKKVHTAFVEFKNEEHAKAALNLSGTKVGLHEICIRDAYSLINDKDILKNNFSFYSNNTMGENSSNNLVNTNTIMNSTNNLAIINNMNNINNINNNNKFLLTTNPNVNQKVEKVLALKEKLAMKLCAMYNPNMLLVNNLVQATNPYLLNVNNTENANLQQINLETANSRQEGKRNDTQNDKTEKENEKENEKEKDKENEKDKEKDNNSIDKSSYDRHRERKKSDNIKIKKYKHKNSTSSKYSYSSYSEEKTSSRSYSRSSTSSNKHKRNTISYVRREKKYIYDKNKKRKRSYNYSKSNSSYSNSKSNSRSSYESDYHRYKSSYRKISKRKRSHKYTTSSSRSNSSYSERRRRSRRDSEVSKPWWVKESEKMKMRQKIKEKKNA
ncbi:hypothetical protein PFNF135_01403 [Plasmodium falciparum NF135/5.C10]|uniref:Negative elongation factor E n=2 Tax=Plasmodium falciparum NF135/5.C10 TaxID=1036726 RepID=W4IM30_PLAFA|nr:hypothetical protein PFNF135_01403 [Plasmodium falciparum NF135/5.C10]